MRYQSGDLKPLPKNRRTDIKKDRNKEDTPQAKIKNKNKSKTNKQTNKQTKKQTNNCPQNTTYQAKDKQHETRVENRELNICMIFILQKI